MSRNDIVEKLKEILIETCELSIPKSEIELKDGFAEEYGINSIVALEFLIQVERTFNIEIDDDDLDESLLQNEEKLVGYIDNKMHE